MQVGTSRGGKEYPKFISSEIDLEDVFGSLTGFGFDGDEMVSNQSEEELNDSEDKESVQSDQEDSDD